MAPISMSYLDSRYTSKCYSNCSSPNLSGLAGIIGVVLLILLVVYLYKLNKAKRLHREKNIPYSKTKIFGQALLAATIVGAIVLIADQGAGSNNTSGGDSGTVPAGGGSGAGMGAQMQSEGFAMNMNNMANQSTSAAAPDPIQ